MGSRRLTAWDMARFRDWLFEDFERRLPWPIR
jgi:hypothetical protein